jgi:hypothetical protein
LSLEAVSVKPAAGVTESPDKEIEIGRDGPPGGVVRSATGPMPGLSIKKLCSGAQAEPTKAESTDWTLQ